MTTWVYELEHHSKIKITRYGLSISCPDESVVILFTEENRLELVNFAAQLLYVLREKNPNLVRKGLFQSLEATKLTCKKRAVYG